jgi:hypothetical protein
MVDLYTPSPGDIGLTQIQGGIGVGIRAAQWLGGDGFANFEHAFTYTGNGWIVEAEPGGARKAALAEYATSMVAWLHCPVQYGAAVAAAAGSYLGVPYSFLDYAAIAAHRLHLPTPGLHAYIADTGHMICSQLADRAAADGGWHLFADGRWSGYVTPGDLYHLQIVQDEIALRAGDEG